MSIAREKVLETRNKAKFYRSTWRIRTRENVIIDNCDTILTLFTLKRLLLGIIVVECVELGIDLSRNTK